MVQSTAQAIWRGALTAILLLTTSGCDVEWGGGYITLENPAPPPDTTVAEEDLEPEQIPLPTDPHLHLVRLEPDGAARSVPIASFGPEDPPFGDVLVPEADPSYRARFDSAFLAPQSELELLSRGVRIGTLVLDGRSRSGAGACPSIATGQAVVSPGQSVPSWALAAPVGTTTTGLPQRIAPLQVEPGMARASPVLAENLIGGSRAFLAQRMALAPIRLIGDSLPGMTATYLIADSLAAGPPGENAVSLFFVARREPTRGFVSIWEEVRRYDAADDKESFEHLDWTRLANGRVDALRRYGGASVRIALALTAEAGASEIVWTEPAECGSFGRLASP
ncbi:MAG: hypothetical protein MJB57_06325 [Gemmatimonadetes bacterium]|nr:hypothetical protein [Gemmatimonadota bacterium]